MKPATVLADIGTRRLRHTRIVAEGYKTPQVDVRLLLMEDRDVMYRRLRAVELHFAEGPDAAAVLEAGRLTGEQRGD